MGKYVYGIINNGSHAAGSSLLTSKGIYTVPCMSVSAVVSDSVIIDYSNMPGDAAAQHLIQHQLVIEKMMEKFSVIPMRLGTYVLNKDELIQVLTKGYRMFKEIFEKIEGRIEIDVVAAWVDLNMVIKEISGEEEVKALKQSLLNKKEGITIDDQMKMGMLIKSNINKKKSECAHIIKNSLKDLCRSMKDYTMQDDMTILNAAFFIDNGMRVPFEERLDELNNGFNGKIHFKCIGPLPPYNFFALEIKRFEFDEIDKARKMLALDDVVMKEDIKKAYKQAAAKHHPDKQSGELNAETKMNEVTNAYKMLSEYCQSGACSFRENDFAGNRLIARIKG